MLVKAGKDVACKTRLRNAKLYDKERTACQNGTKGSKICKDSHDKEAPWTLN